jgi:Spy/CpxP family protein refolding chaperone
MKTIRIKTLVLLVFVLTLGAGVVAGLLAARLPASGTARAQAGDSPLGEELALTAEQREKMKTIWEGVRGFTEDCIRQSSKAQSDRDEKIFALIPREKVDQYNAIRSNYDNAVAGLQGRREKAFADAVKKTREILSPDQRGKYDKILKKRLGAEFGGAQDAIGASAAVPRCCGDRIAKSQVTYPADSADGNN